MNAFHQTFMDRAIALSAKSLNEAPGGPFGAVIVFENQIISEGWNEVTSMLDPTAHAEMQAIRKACAVRGDFNLKGAILYSSCEPCPMCLAAIYWSRIERVYYANTRVDAGAIGFDDALIYEELTRIPQERKLTCEHHPSIEAMMVFKKWDGLTFKLRY